jgi:preprotein translocase subunit SecA
MIADYVDSQVQRYLNPELEPEERDVGALRVAVLEAVPQLEASTSRRCARPATPTRRPRWWCRPRGAYAARETELGAELLRELERFIVLQVVDQHWKEHLHNMDVLRQGIGLRGYGQRNPLQEYAFEGFNLFEEMTANIKLNVAKLLFRVQVQTRLAARAARGAHRPAFEQSGPAHVGAGDGPTKPITSEEKVGRNDPCPCGSGKKYKHCHGRVAA